MMFSTPVSKMHVDRTSVRIAAARVLYVSVCDRHTCELHALRPHAIRVRCSSLNRWTFLFACCAPGMLSLHVVSVEVMFSPTARARDHEL